MQIQRSPDNTRNRGRSNPCSTHSNAEDVTLSVITDDSQGTDVLTRLQQLENQLSENQNQMAQIIKLLQSTDQHKVENSTLHFHPSA